MKAAQYSAKSHEIEPDATTVAEMIGEEMTSVDVSGDGNRFRISFRRQDSRLGSLDLPAECLNALIMTLPRLMTRALKARCQDESLRLVFPASNIRIEQSTDLKIVIATFTTPDGFEVSFGLTKQDIEVFTDAAALADTVQLPKCN
jgi:hypothetical protein